MARKQESSADQPEFLNDKDAAQEREAKKEGKEWRSETKSNDRKKDAAEVVNDVIQNTFEH